MTTEQIFFDDAGVQVTSARFITRGQTLAMSGVTAVTALRHGLTRFQILLLIGGVVLLFMADTASPRVTAVAMIAYALWYWLRPPYSVVVTSASGRHRVLTDRRRQRIFAIVAAVNDAIVYRA